MEMNRTKQLVRGSTQHNNPLELLIYVLEASLELISLPENDFCWCFWADSDEAKAELEGLINSLKAGVLPARTHFAVLFAPTGPLQELSLSSGWAETFLKVASKYDEAEARLW